MRARWRLIACAGYAPLGLVRTMHRLKADGFKVAAIRPLQGDGLPTKYPIANGKSVKGFFFFTMVFWKLKIMTGAHGVVVSHPLRMRKALGSIPSVSISCQKEAGCSSNRSCEARNFENPAARRAPAGRAQGS